MVRHKNPTNSNRTAHAPYNFIALPEKVKAIDPADLPRFDHYEQGRNTGCLELTITTETPLYVRCGPKTDDIQTKEDPRHGHADLTRRHRHRQDFFHHGNSEYPVIPGSALRGMVRSLVEIVGFGKLQWFTDKQLVYRAIGDSSSLGQRYRKRMSSPRSQLRGGYLEKRDSGWAIRPAREFYGESFVQVDYTCHSWTGKRTSGAYGKSDLIEVFVKPVRSTRSARPRSAPKLACIKSLEYIQKKTGNASLSAGFVEGVLVKSGHMKGKRKHSVIFAKNPDADPVPIPHKIWKLYEEDRDLTRGTHTRKLDRPGTPLFYLVDSETETPDNPDGLVFFGPTRMFRLPYEYCIGKFIPADLRSPRDKDLADAIFGTVDTKSAIKGRVYFEDARWDGNGGNRLEKRIIPKILSAPKPTSFQHYLVQPTNKAKKLHNWDQPDPGEHDSKGPRNVIRGHKRYWHKPETAVATARDENARISTNGQGVETRTKGGWQESTQHTVIRPVKKGTVFIGRVRFENLSDHELGALLSVLQLPSHMRHQLGMGKSLGMGSVKITTALNLTARTGKQNRYTNLFGSDGKFHLGERSTERNKEIEQKAKKTFGRSMVQHHNNCTSITRLRPDANLWDIPRFQDLALMLEWDRAPSADKTAYMPLDNRWRERPVLPMPDGVEPVTQGNR